jgi:hypothetical protein
MKTILLVIVVVLWFAGCGKDKGNTPIVQQSFADFLKNTEWVGTLDRNGFQYRPPCSLKFNADNTFTMYSLFVFFPNGVDREIRDSITGTINSIDSLPDGRTRITTNITTSFNGGSTQSIYITDRQKLQGISSNQSAETFQLSLFPATSMTSVHGSWRGLAGTIYDHYTYAYPDVSSINFHDNETPPATYYGRNGQPVLLAPPNVSLKYVYQQKGARIYFAGYNETRGTGDIAMIPYFGVLLPSGDKMMVHSLDFYARLPNYINTSEPYGHNGATPIIQKY